MGIIEDANQAAADKQAADEAEAKAAAEQATVDAEEAAVNPTPAAPVAPPAAPAPSASAQYFYCLRAGHPRAKDLIGDATRIFSVESDTPLTGPPFCPECNQYVVAHSVEVDSEGQPQIPTSIVALGERLNAPVNY